MLTGACIAHFGSDSYGIGSRDSVSSGWYGKLRTRCLTGDAAAAAGAACCAARAPKCCSRVRPARAPALIAICVSAAMAARASDGGPPVPPGCTQWRCHGHHNGRSHASHAPTKLASKAPAGIAGASSRAAALPCFQQLKSMMYSLATWRFYTTNAVKLLNWSRYALVPSLHAIVLIPGALG